MIKSVFSLLVFVFQSEQDGLWEAGPGASQEVCPHIKRSASHYPTCSASTDNQTWGRQLQKDHSNKNQVLSIIILLYRWQPSLYFFSFFLSLLNNKTLILPVFEKYRCILNA